MSANMKEWDIKKLQEHAENGEADAQFNLGARYAKGCGVGRDPKKAIEWYTRAAEQGHTAAQFNLGAYYAYGSGVEQDSKKAVEWFIRAAKRGDAFAQNSLGSCYLQGEGVAKDTKKAIVCYRRAAKQGHIAAQFNLGACYATGDGVERDLTQAVEWYRRAAEKGHTKAQHALQELRALFGIASSLAAAQGSVLSFSSSSSAGVARAPVCSKKVKGGDKAVERKVRDEAVERKVQKDGGCGAVAAAAPVPIPHLLLRVGKTLDDIRKGMIDALTTYQKLCTENVENLSWGFKTLALKKISGNSKKERKRQPWIEASKADLKSLESFMDQIEKLCEGISTIRDMTVEYGNLILGSPQVTDPIALRKHVTILQKKLEDVQSLPLHIQGLVKEIGALATSIECRNKNIRNFIAQEDITPPKQFAGREEIQERLSAREQQIIGVKNQLEWFLHSERQAAGAPRFERVFERKVVEEVDAAAAATAAALAAAAAAASPPTRLDEKRSSSRRAGDISRSVMSLSHAQASMSEEGKEESKEVLETSIRSDALPARRQPDPRDSFEKRDAFRKRKQKAKQRAKQQEKRKKIITDVNAGAPLPEGIPLKSGLRKVSKKPMPVGFSREPLSGHKAASSSSASESAIEGAVRGSLWEHISPELFHHLSLKDLKVFVTERLSPEKNPNFDALLGVFICIARDYTQHNVHIREITECLKVGLGQLLKEREVTEIKEREERSVYRSLWQLAQKWIEFLVSHTVDLEDERTIEAAIDNPYFAELLKKGRELIHGADRSARGAFWRAFNERIDPARCLKCIKASNDLLSYCRDTLDREDPRMAKVLIEYYYFDIGTQIQLLKQAEQGEDLKKAAEAARILRGIDAFSLGESLEGFEREGLYWSHFEVQDSPLVLARAAVAGESYIDLGIQARHKVTEAPGKPILTGYPARRPDIRGAGVQVGTSTRGKGAELAISESRQDVSAAAPGSGNPGVGSVSGPNVWEVQAKNTADGGGMGLGGSTLTSSPSAARVSDAPSTVVSASVDGARGSASTRVP